MYLMGEVVLRICKKYRASEFFQDWWAEVTHEAKNGGSFSEMMGSCKHIKLTTVDMWVVYFIYTLTLVCILTADYTAKPV